MLPSLPILKSRQNSFYTSLILTLNLFLKSLKHYLPIVFPLFTIALWITFSVWINTAQFGDNIEQFNWAHGPEWGYWKHPPLPTLLLAGVIAVFGNWIYWTYCLAALCFIGTTFFTWKLASKLLGEHAGAVAAILLGLHQGFSVRAQIYNHNTVLLLAVSAAAWSSLLAVERKNWWRWAIAGSLAGLALLAKYQAVVPLLGILLALQRSGAFREKENLRGLGFALLAACLIFLPHFVWLWINDFPTVQYAKHSMQNLDAVARINTLFRFLIRQIQVHRPMLITLGLIIGYSYLKNRAIKLDGINTNSPLISAWLWGLVGFPVIFLILMTLLGGVHLEGHWGLQTFQFVSLLLVWRFKTLIDRIGMRYFVMVALLAHAFVIGWCYQSQKAEREHISQKRIDVIYPGQLMADKAVMAWQKATHCPLKYVVGPAFEAGLISLYSGSFPAVQEDGDPAKSPWIRSSDIARYGAIQVWTKIDSIPTGIIPDGELDMPRQSSDGGGPQKVYWHITLPQQPCAASN